MKSSCASSASGDDAQSDGSASSYGGSASPRSVAYGARLLQLIISGNGDARSFLADHPFAIELLAIRRVKHWVAVIARVEHCLSAVSTASHAARDLLHGHTTLYEALCSLGPEWYRTISALRALAQHQLFTSLKDGLDSTYWPQPLATLLRAGASLLRVDDQGRVPALVAAQSASDLLATLAQRVPGALLVEDSEGETALDVVNQMESLWLGQWGEGQGVLDALADAALTCLASMPEHTRRVLRRRPGALNAWKKLAEHSGCAPLLMAWDESGVAEQKLTDLEQKAEVQEGLAVARYRQGLGRVALLQSLAAEAASELEELEPQELKLRLLRAEATLQQKEEDNKQKVNALEKEVDRLKGLVLERERELLGLRSGTGAGPQVQAAIANHASQGPPSGVQKSEVPASAEEPPKQGRAAKGAKSLKGKAKQPAKDKEAPRGAEKDVVTEIAQMRCIGADVSTLPADVRLGIAEMRASLTAAVDRLAHDLYESEVHFIQELLQNADDNQYSAGTTPKFHCFVRSDHGIDGRQPYFYCTNNEVGLTEKDVRAICDIARSSKQAMSGATTGCKGVGWKSVFRVCTDPHVLSGGWRFKFSSPGLGMLTPQWLNDEVYGELPEEVRQAHAAGQTVFYLPLTDIGVVHSIEMEMQSMEQDPVQMIFFRHLQEVNVHYAAGRAVRLAAVGEEPRSSTLREVISEGVSPDAVPGTREGESVRTDFEICVEQDVTVALPNVDEPPPQRVFSFLPVRAVGFHFAVQAPFHTTASRSDFHRSPENARRRDAISHAFLGACKAHGNIGAQALKYLGSEPVEPFWMLAWMNILAGLREMACVQTESGQAAPHSCIVRGEDAAVKWISESFLSEACGLHFASASNPQDALRHLGVRFFGFDDLVVCLRHNDGQLVKTMWGQPTRSSFFSDLYSSLADSLQADTSRLDELLDLNIYPLAHRSAQSSLGVQTFSDAKDLCTGFCDSVPQAWQEPLVSRLTQDLVLTRRAQQLFSFIGIKAVDEILLEELALREVLKPTCFTSSSPRAAYPFWCGLAILRRCFLLGRNTSRPWEELGKALVIPSETGQFMPLRSLQLRSFVDVDTELPRGIAENICAFAGVTVRSPIAAERVARPALPADGTFWRFEWEVFLWALGCQPANPNAGNAEGLVEVTLKLGKVLSSGSFWQCAAQHSSAMAYLNSLLGPGADPRRHRWLRRLPVPTPPDGVVALGDLFLQEVFQMLVGSHVSYVIGAPWLPEVHALLSSLGVAVELNRASLQKCIRYLRGRRVFDVGVAADIYMKLDEFGYAPPSDEEFILVPGCGYFRTTECSWKPFSNPLLQRSCRTHSLVQHYGRFGPSVCAPLERWVRFEPEADAEVLCDSLLQAIKLAKGTPASALHLQGCEAPTAEEAVRGLFGAAKHVVEALAGMCACEELLPEEPGYLPCTVAMRFFTQNAMIVLPDPGSTPQAPRVRLLRVQKAYWTVSPELEDHACAAWALERHYGNNVAVQAFFTCMLNVCYSFGPQDLRYRMSQTSQGSDLEGNLRIQEGLEFSSTAVPASSPSFAMGSGSPANGSSGGGGGFGLPNRSSVPDGSTMPAPFRQGSGSDWPVPLDLSRSLLPSPSTPSASSDAPPAAPLLPNWGRDPSQLGFQSPTNHGRVETPPYQASGHLSHQQARSPCAAQPHHGSPSSLLARRQWRTVGRAGRLNILVAGDQQPPNVDRRSLRLLYRVLTIFGVTASQIAFAFDPSGRCVCDQELLMDLTGLQRAAACQDASSTMVFWGMELAHAMAHQMAGSGVGEDFIRVQRELLMRHLPQILHAASQE